MAISNPERASCIRHQIFCFFCNATERVALQHKLYLTAVLCITTHCDSPLRYHVPLFPIIPPLSEPSCLATTSATLIAHKTIPLFKATNASSPMDSTETNALSPLLPSLSNFLDVRGAANPYHNSFPTNPLSLTAPRTMFLSPKRVPITPRRPV